MSSSNTIALHVQLACIWEATARKAGNVHRYRDFADTSYVDFLQCAAVIAPVLAAAPENSVGATVLEAVRRCGQVAATNTNLGIVLLLTPLAKAAAKGNLRSELAQILDGLDATDAARVYDAIRLANPGGLGRAAEQDVADAPTQTLREVMALAAERDLVARQYANGFREVFDDGVPAIEAGLRQTGSLEGGIGYGQLQLLAKHGDTLIGRKRGAAESAAAAKQARQILAAHWPHTSASWDRFHAYDGWLRAVGHARNPGTTADLIAASLFVLLAEGRLQLPLRFPWPDGFER